MILNSPTISGSLTVTGNILTSGSITLSGSVASASYADTASFVALAQSASNAVSAATASFANAFTVASTLTAQTLVVQTITSSVDFVTGSTRFGSIAANTHVFTGSLQTTGSNTFSGYSVFSSNINEVARFKSSYANGVYLTFESGSTTIGDIGNSSEVFTGASTLDFGINARGNRKLQLGVNQTIVLTITGSNVGIGTITPANKLNVLVDGGGSDDGILIGVGSQGDGIKIVQRYLSNRVVATLGQSNYSGATDSGALRLYDVGGTETIRLSGKSSVNSFINSGNVGIGTSSPLQTAANRTVLTINATTSNVLNFGVGGTLSGYIYNDASTTGLYAQGDLYLQADGAKFTAFVNNSVERMRITSGGIIQLGSSERRNALQQSTFGYGGSYRTLLIGSTGTDYTTNAVTLAFNVDLSGNPSGAYGGDGTEYFWRNVGSFKTPNSSNNGYNTLLSWNSSGVVTVTTSDYRAKEDLKSFEALPMVEAMKLYDFRWIELQNRMHGVLAHELQDIVPYAVMGEKDGESMQGVDYSKLVPVMLKAIQEQQTLIQDLQSQINELKAQ